MQIWQMNTWELLLSGGPLMIPILACSLFSWVVIAEKIFFFSSFKESPSAIRKQVFALVKANKITDAIFLSDGIRSPIAKILAAGLLKFGSPKEEIKEAMSLTCQAEIPILEQRLTILLTTAHVAPLLGFLGTAIGLALSFHTIQTRTTSMLAVTPGDLAAGIWQALITTIAGLAVAIPAYIFYNYFLDRINMLIKEAAQSMDELLDYLGQM